MRRMSGPRIALVVGLAGSLSVSAPALANKKQEKQPTATKAAPAAAAPGGPETGPEQPEILTEGPEIPTTEKASQVDLASLVTSAAKSVTTVQEAPAIVTVITAEEMRRRGFRRVTDAMVDVPGWGHWPGEGHSVYSPLTRGTPLSALFLRDGVSLNSPFVQTGSYHYFMPIENIKRIEVVTGPGGVLWGANSFLGIMNIINKDAEDVDGVEVSAGYGDGSGAQSYFKAYGMFGKVLAGGKVKIFQHISYENFLGEEYTMLQNVLSSPAPQPNGPLYYGPALTSSLPRSQIVNIDGKFSAGPVSLIYNVPIAEVHIPLTFPSTVVHTGLPPTVGANEIPGVAPGSPRPYNPTSQTDPLGAAKDHRMQWFERYAILEYKSRFLDDRFGLNSRGYWVESVRNFPYFGIFTPSALLPGGLTFRGHQDVRTLGGAIDTDYQISPKIRVIAGFESFYEQDKNSNIDFIGPYDADPMSANYGRQDSSKLPFYCPPSNGIDGAVTPPGITPGCKVAFAFDGDRSVIGAFIDGQVRPHPKVVLDAGVRGQRAYGINPYDTQILASGGAVWNFLPDWHLKLNYAEGFRPPNFLAANGNGAAVNYAGSPNMVPESSQAGQGEINARLLRNVRRVRELALRWDYAYTLLNHYIVVQDGRWINTGKRSIHSGEFLGKLYLRGDHALSFGYSYNHITTEDRGTLHSLPNHWFTAGAVFNVIKDRLDVNTNLQVIGALEDPDRTPNNTGTGPLPGLRPANNSDVTLDRIAATSLLQIGFRVKGLLSNHLDITGNVYNLLNQRWFYADGFNERSPRLELLPLPGQGLSAFASAIVKY